MNGEPNAPDTDSPINHQPSTTNHSLRLIVGPSISGKTACILDAFRRFTPAEHRASVRLIVPSVAHVIRLRKLLVSDPTYPGIFGDPICTFARFASELIPDTPGLVTDTQRRLVLQEVIRNAPEGCFDEVRGLPGFLPELSAAIRTLHESGVAADDLSAACDFLPAHAARRVRNLALLCSAYDSALCERGVAEPEGLLRHAVNLLSADPSPLSALKCVLFDGLDDFSPAGRDLIGLLGRHCEQVIVTADDELTFPDASVDTLNPEPTDLELCMFVAADQRMQIEMIAREIRRLVREHGFHRSDIAVVTRIMRDHRRIAGILGEFRVPVSAEVHLLSRTPLALRVLSRIEDLGSGAAVRSFLQETPLPEDENQLREHCAAWKAILRIVDGIPDDGLFRDLIRAGIESGTYRLPGEVSDGVALLTAGSLNGRCFRAVFVLDAADGVFPRRLDDDPFIRDSERQVLNTHLPHLLPTLADAEARERRLFSRVTSSAVDRLYLCRTAEDEPSPYIHDLPCTGCGPGDILPPIAQAETADELAARTILDLCTSDDPVAAETYNRLLDAGLLGADTFSRLGSDFDEFIPAHLRLLAEEPPEDQ